MGLSGYSDYLLFRKAETAFGIFPLNVKTQKHVTPTNLSQTEYETELVNQYNTGMTENERAIAEYRTNTLVNFITGVTSSAGSMTSFTVEGDNGTPFTITNGDTLEFVGSTGIDIGVADPEVRVAIDYNGVDSFIMAATNGTSMTVDGANDKLAIYDNDDAVVKYINANQLPSDTGDYWSASSSTNHAIIASGYGNSIVGIGTNDPMATLHVNGSGPISDTTISASSSGASASIRLSGNTGSHIHLDTTETGGAAGSNAFISFRSKNNPVWVVGKNNEDATAGPNNFVIATAASFDSNYVVVVTSGGSMGLNTETPQRALHIEGPSRTETPLRVNTLQTIDKSEIPYAGIMLGTPDGDVHTASTRTLNLTYWSASSVNGNTNIVNSGTSINGVSTTKVGIGTLQPNLPLSVSGTVSASTSYTAPDFDSNYVKFYTADTTTLVGVDGGGTSYEGANQVTGVGHQVFKNLVSGLDANTAIGYQAAIYMSGGSSQRNVFVGSESGPANLGAGSNTMSANVMIGDRAGLNSAGNASVSNNVLVGAGAAGGASFAGSQNVILGTSAGSLATTASNNIIIGYQAADNIISANNCVLIGHDTDLGSPSANRQVDIAGVFLGVDATPGKDGLSTNAISIGTGTSTAFITKTFTVSGETLLNDHVTLPDDVKLKLGNGNGTSGDLEIYHDGNNSYIDDAGTGTIFYRSGTQTFQNAAGTKTSAVFNSGSDQELYFNNNLRFATTNTGAVVTDDLNISGDTVSSGSTSFSGLTHDQIYDMRDYEDSGKALPSDGDGTGFIILGQTHTSITTTGMLCNMYLSSWYVTQPSTPLYLTGATGVALSDTHTTTDRILLHGFVRIPDSLMNDAVGSSLDRGKPIYADPDTAGEYTVDVGQFTTGEYVKGVGHIMDYDSTSSSYLLYINPSQDFIKIA